MYDLVDLGDVEGSSGSGLSSPHGRRQMRLQGSNETQVCSAQHCTFLHGPENPSQPGVLCRADISGSKYCRIVVATSSTVTFLIFPEQ
ncbi:Uncharacterized protein DAT39_015173 [Clarias magur]|uniref:Uncharacterized protein n=1 Tax=Clarias magur TaxID=1594786 RepID=A0A8J4TZ82_CLAMG|nr:Uncharacterized protein DAT39_015173 [Clarias magur]